MKTLYTLILLCFAAVHLIAQDTARIAYSFGFNFKNGIYLNFDQFRNNSPVAIESVVIDFDKNKYNDVYDYIDNSKTLQYYNEFGILSETSTASLWGYCRNGKPWVNWSNGFRQIGFIGSVCHFVATIIVYQDMSASPYYDPYSYNYMGSNQYYTSELHQLIITMNTGEILDFDVENVARAISSDTALYNEFNDLSKRKKRNMMFYYIRKFNENHPLYLPSK
ncbi:MAG: hypothetical protein KBB11_08710 [Bacteroidales bacterium]|nr:hypothetical protein [Bacteroidales bacterium]HOY39401.1 hypothetical protein [Bacteroidales bacterium]